MPACGHEQKIFEEIDGAAVIRYDETMYRVLGIPAWLWIAVTRQGVYVIQNARLRAGH